MLNESAPTPAHIAIVRFSALGDLVLTQPLLRNLQNSFPLARLTFVTSPLGHELLGGMAGVEFEVFDKPQSLADYRRFYRAFRNRRFDAVLALQANLRINFLYPALHAPLKIGFDHMRANEGQWLFCNRQINYNGPHLLDSFLAFGDKLGASPQPAEWNLPLSDADHAWAESALKNLPRPVIAMHPVSSKAERNWPLERYAEVVGAALKSGKCSFVFTGGNHALEQQYCAHLAQVAGAAGVNLCGLTTPRQLAAVLGKVDGLIAPDTAAVHIARAMNTPVIGLYAVVSSELSGPYGRMEYVVDRYPDAVRKLLGKDPLTVPWNTRVHHPDAMRFITVQNVLQQLDRLLRDR
jgi:heptosyltransferase I